MKEKSDSKRLALQAKKHKVLALVPACNLLIHLVCFIRNAYKERLFEGSEILGNLRNRDPWILVYKEHPKTLYISKKQKVQLCTHSLEH